jgi:hypothetical protein
MRKTAVILLLVICLVGLGEERASALFLCVTADDLSGGKCETSDCVDSCSSSSSMRGPRMAIASERALYLTRLARVEAAAEPLKAKIWAKDLFSLALTMPVGWDRVATEKNVLVPLSTIDPQLSMDLFFQVENPLPDLDGDFPEDVRADAAVHIFLNYWRFAGAKGLPQIEKLARQIGDTGEYPFRAMGMILQELGASQEGDRQSSAANILAEALRYYKQRSKFLNRDEEFLNLLQRAGVVLNNDRYREALSVFVRRLITASSMKKHYIAEIGTARGTILFLDQNRALLFRTIPLLLGTNRRWAQSLITQYPELSKANDGIVYIAAGAVHGNPTQPQLRAMQKEVLERALATNVQKLEQTNPLVARLLAERLARQNVSTVASSSVLRRQAQ